MPTKKKKTKGKGAQDSDEGGKLTVEDAGGEDLGEEAVPGGDGGGDGGEAADAAAVEEAIASLARRGGGGGGGGDGTTGDDGGGADDGGDEGDGGANEGEGEDEGTASSPGRRSALRSARKSDASSSSSSSSARDERWKSNLSDLRGYVEAHGGTYNQIKKSEHPKLSSWVNSQRAARKAGTLSKERIELLDEVLGADWERGGSQDERWNGSYEELVAYKETHGDTDVKTTGERGKLGQWIRIQRAARQAGRLSEERIRKLEELDFRWDVGDTSLEGRWWDHLSQLAAYKSEHGNCNVRKVGEHAKLGQWVDVQRTKQKEGKLSDERVRLLNELGFKWGVPRKTPQERVGWDGRYEQLRAHYALHGHVKVSKSDPAARKLGIWCQDQKTAWKRGKLSQERIDKLNALGFSWAPRGGGGGGGGGDVVVVPPGNGDGEDEDDDDDDRKPPPPPAAPRLSWDERVAQLREHYRRTGSCDVPGTAGLGGWVRAQRQKRRRGDLSDDRIAELDAMGFHWGGAPPAEAAAGAAAGAVGVVGEQGREGSLADLYLTVAPGELGFAVEIDEEAGCAASVTAVDPECAYRDKIAAGDRLATIDGREVTSVADLLEGTDRPRVFGFAKAGGGSTPTANNPVPPAAGGGGPYVPEKDVQWAQRLEELRRFGAEHGHFKVPLSTHSHLRKWIDRQRHARKRDKLGPDRVAALEGIGFAFETSQSRQLTFEDRLALLREYVGIHGDANVPLSHPQLGKWAWHQRDQYRKLSMGDDRVRALEAAGFDFQATWDERVAQLGRYREATGNANPPQTHAILGEFVKSVRQAYRREGLPPDRVAALDALGFVLQCNGARPKASWMSQYELLRQYKAEHGHCRAPRSHPLLGTWVDNQRRAFKKGNLSQEHLDALEAIGMEWGSTRKDPETSWREQYDQLVAYKEAHGDTSVPQAHDGLGRFVHWQRYTRKKNKMPQERVDLLDAIGFDWGRDAYEAVMTWDERFAQLQRHKDEFGHVNVSRNHAAPGYDGLGRWVDNQRSRLETMPEERRSRLTDIGVKPQWKLNKQSWEEQFANLKRHKEARGDCNDLAGAPTEVSRFVEIQRRYHRYDKLSEERGELLRSLGLNLDTREVVWEEKLAQLQRHKEARGDCNDVAGMDAELAKFVQTQRRHHKSGKLAEDNAERLRSVGLVLEKKAVAWEELFSRLQLYKDLHGDCNDLTGMDAELLRFVRGQRRSFKKSNELPEDRAERLRTLGLELDPKAIADVHVKAPPGSLGLGIHTGPEILGAKITMIDDACPFKGQIEVGDRIVTIDGKRVTQVEDLIGDGERSVGIATKPRRGANKRKAGEMGHSESPTDKLHSNSDSDGGGVSRKKTKTDPTAKDETPSDEKAKQTPKRGPGRPRKSLEL